MLNDDGSTTRPFFQRPTATIQDTIDLRPGERQFVKTYDEARKMLANGMNTPNSITSMTLSTKSFYPAAAPAIAELIHANRSSLRYVDISDIISGQPHSEAMKVIQVIAEALEGMTLDVLDLSNQALSIEGIQTLESVFKSCKIKSLKLNNVGMSWEACKQLAQSLDVSRLSTLEVHNNMLRNNDKQKETHPLATIISKTTSLEHVRISSTRIEKTGLIAILNALSDQEGLISLNISDSYFDEEVLNPFDKILKTSAATLQDLMINDCGCGRQILDKLKAHPLKTLKQLELNGCDLGDDDVDSIVLYIACDGPDTLVSVSLKDISFSEKAMSRLSRAKARIAHFALTFDVEDELSDDSQPANSM
jgi:hypothetical protein